MPNEFQYLAQSRMPNIVGAFQQGQDRATQRQREQLADQELKAKLGRENQLRQLAPQEYAASTPEQQQAYLAQVAAVNPQDAAAASERLAVGNTRKEALKINTARLLMSLPAESRATQYQKMIPTFRQAGMDAPDAYTPELDKMMQAYAKQQTGSGVQSTLIGNDGQYYTVDRATGRMTPTGVLAAPNVRVLEQEGQAPYGVVTGRGAAGQVVPLGGGQSQAAPQTTQQPAPSTMGQPAASAPTQPGAGPIRIPTAAEKARDVAQAQAAVELQTKPQIAQRTAEATELGKTAAERQETQRKNQTAFSVYSTGMNNLRQAMAGTDTGPLAGRIPAITSAQQIAEGAGAAMAPVLKQLFREAGEGTFTEGDQKLLTDMLPKRTDHPEAAKAKLQMIDQLVAAKLGMQSDKAAPATSSSTEVTATGPNGQKLVLRNGQWTPLQ